MRPVKRSALRMHAGITYYRWKRYAKWLLGRKTFATKREQKPLPYVVFRHKTPLFRALRNVDMWLQHNKITNLHIAANQLTGVVVQPGETFSYWYLIGKPTSRKGYKEGMILSHGNVTSGTGGGLCQLSNLIYWMTLHSPLTVTERYRHSYDVFPDTNRKQPFGSGATCFYNYMDLQIGNRTDCCYQLNVEVTNTHLVGEWRSDTPPMHTYEIYEREHWITPEYWGGYVRHNTIYRKVLNLDRVEVDDQFIAENHAIMMYEPFLAEKSSF